MKVNTRECCTKHSRESVSFYMTSYTGAYSCVTGQTPSAVGVQISHQNMDNHELYNKISKHLYNKVKVELLVNP